MQDVSAQTVTARQLVETARVELSEVFALNSGEHVVVLTDTFNNTDERFRIANTLHSVAKELANSELICFAPLKQSGVDPPEKIVQAMQQADVVLIVTSRSLTHARASVEAVRKGARIGTHTRFIDSYVRAVGHISAIKERGDKLVEALNSQDDAILRLTTEEGTDLSVSMGKRKFRNWAGDLRKPGSIENIPAGEVLFAPPEGQGEGKVFVNLRLPSWASSTLPYEMIVRQGRLVACPQDPELMRKYKAVADRDLLCEVAFGTNHLAFKQARCIMEVEKTLGTAHVAFGSNVDFGGDNQSDVHMDFIFDKVTLTLDGRTIIDNGQFCI